MEQSQISLYRVSVLNDTEQRMLTSTIMFNAYPLNHTVYFAYNSEVQMQSFSHDYKEQYRIHHVIFTHCTREHLPSPKPSSELHVIHIPPCNVC